MILALDLETFSACDLLRCGAEAYAEHTSTGVHCAVFGWVEGGERMVWTPGQDLPPAVVAHVQRGGLLLAHNAAFESALIRGCLTPYYGWPVVQPEQWLDTMHLAAAANLPRGLDALAKALGAPVMKDMEGHKLMMHLCEIVDTPSPAELARLIEYCATDVATTIACYQRLPKPPLAEFAVMTADREMNERGVAVDIQLATALASIGATRADELADDVFVNSMELATTSNPHAFKAWLRSRGIEIPKLRRGAKTRETLDRGAIAEILAGDPPPDVRAVLEARVEAGRVTSLTKAARLGEQVNADGRLRGAVNYSAAITGRWTSSGVQIHNLPKPAKAFPRVAFLDAILAGDLERARSLWPILTGLSYSLRSLFVAAPGKMLVGADYSAIEARVIAWLAGETETLARYARGEDVYVADAAAIDSTDRQLGKVCRLGLGYGMGPVRFLSTAANAGIMLEPKRAREIVRTWRDANPNIVQFWSDLEAACLDAMNNRGEKFHAGRIEVHAGAAALYLRLPSGRSITYWRPTTRWQTRKFDVVKEDGTIETVEKKMQELCFYTPGGKGMGVEGTYGGKLAENVTQAVARDILAEALVRLRGTRFRVVMHVHDALAAEVDDGTDAVAEFVDRITELPSWAAGLPLAAEGYLDTRFRG